MCAPKYVPTFLQNGNELLLPHFFRRKKKNTNNVEVKVYMIECTLEVLQRINKKQKQKLSKYILKSTVNNLVGV